MMLLQETTRPDMSLTRNMGVGTKIVPPKNITNVIVKI